jgi:hypothetical protein
LILQHILPGITDPIVKLVTSSNYKSFALLRESGEVFIGSRELLGQSQQEFVLKYSSPEKKDCLTDIAWCGSDTVIGLRATSAAWYDLLIIDATNKKTMR